jgi:lysophospholipase L1-like esterase
MSWNKRGFAWRVAGGVLTVALTLAGCGGGGSRSTGSSSSSRPTPANFDFGANSPLRVTAFGDSITFGVLELQVRSSRLATGNNSPNILQSMLRGLDSGYRVINRGVPGEQTASGLRRFGGTLGADKPGFVLIMEGTNDATLGGSAGAIAGNLEGMVDIAQNSRTIPVLGTIPPNFRNDPGAQDIIREANVQIRAIARARRVVLAEIFNGMNDRSLFGLGPDRDPLHPNERGYAVIAGIWFEALQRAFPVAGSTASPPASPTPTDTGNVVTSTDGKLVKRKK